MVRDQRDERRDDDQGSGGWGGEHLGDLTAALLAQLGAQLAARVGPRPGLTEAAAGVMAFLGDGSALPHRLALYQRVRVINDALRGDPGRAAELPAVIHVDEATQVEPGQLLAGLEGALYASLAPEPGPGVAVVLIRVEPPGYDLGLGLLRLGVEMAAGGFVLGPLLAWWWGEPIWKAIFEGAGMILVPGLAGEATAWAVARYRDGRRVTIPARHDPEPAEPPLAETDDLKQGDLKQGDLERGEEEADPYPELLVTPAPDVVARGSMVEPAAEGPRLASPPVTLPGAPPSPVPGQQPRGGHQPGHQPGADQRPEGGPPLW